MRVRGSVAWLYAAAIFGWVALIASVPMDHEWAFELGRLGIAIGPTCSVVLALRKITVPVVHVYEAGKAAGRAEASVPERRHLRVVDD